MTRHLLSDPDWRRHLAGSTPQSLFRKLYFWKAQKDFWAVVLSGLLSFGLLAPYTYDWNRWVVLTLGVQALAIWGALIAARGMTKIEVEMAIVSEIEANGATYLKAIQDNPENRATLDQLEASILPYNPSNPPPSMIRLFQNIWKEARDRKFESSVSLVQPYREEALEDVFRLQNIQKIALWLGILGTFIGLLRAIQVGDLNLTHDSDEGLANLIANMFGNLFISFSASLAGLEVAVILGALLLILRRRHEAYFQQMESAVVTMLSLARNALNKDEFFVEFSQVRDSMDGLKDELYHQTRTLSGNMEEIQESINRQTEQIQVSIETLRKTNTEFDGFLKHVSYRHQDLMNDVKSVYDAISLKNLGTTLEQSIIQSGRHISETIDPNIRGIAQQLSLFNETLARLHDTMRAQSEEAAANINEIKSAVGRIERLHSQPFSNDWGALTKELSRLNRTLERRNPAAGTSGRSWRNIFTTIGVKLSNFRR